jgi:hypothetical protein
MRVGSGKRAGFMGLSNWLKTVLRKFLEAFRKQHAPSDKGPAKQYSNLVRFIFDKRHFSRAPTAPKPGAFLPDSDLKTSALGRNGLPEGEVWKIGLSIGEGRGKAPKARADFDAEAVSEAKLTIEHDPVIGIPDHVNLCGWPNEKDEQKSIAQLLCFRAKLLFPPATEQAK